MTRNTASNVPDPEIGDIYPLGTNENHEIVCPAVAGGLYRVLTTTNLMVSNSWVSCDVVSANVEGMTWDDTAQSYTNMLRFYRLERIR